MTSAPRHDSPESFGEKEPGRNAPGAGRDKSFGWHLALFLMVAALLPGCGAFGDDGDTTPPSPPSGLSAGSEAGASSLEWSAPQAQDLDGYNVYRSTDVPIDIEADAPLNTDGLVSGTSFTDQDAENGTTYRYRVTAVDESDNESTPSDSARVTPFADPPSRP